MASISVNTEYKLCVNCSGTVSTITPPHPDAVYNGDVITDLSAVLIGGRNGYNS